MGRPIYLVQYPARPFNDHWAIFVPSVANQNVGTLIQVEGDVRNGFTHSIEKNHDTTGDNRKPKFVCLGEVLDDEIHAIPSHGQRDPDDMAPQNRVESCALDTPAPPPSMNSTLSDAPSTERVHLRDCQWWVRQYILMLIQHGIIDQQATAILDKQPKNV